jgi:hypothetical protein
MPRHAARFLTDLPECCEVARKELSSNTTVISARSVVFMIPPLSKPEHVLTATIIGVQKRTSSLHKHGGYLPFVCPFIADSMDSAIASKRPSCGRSSVLIRSLSRKPARFALPGGASVSITYGKYSNSLWRRTEILWLPGVFEMLRSIASAPAGIRSRDHNQRKMPRQEEV